MQRQADLTLQAVQALLHRLRSHVQALQIHPQHQPLHAHTFGFQPGQQLSQIIQGHFRNFAQGIQVTDQHRQSWSGLFCSFENLGQAVHTNEVVQLIIFNGAVQDLPGIDLAGVALDHQLDLLHQSFPELVAVLAAAGRGGKHIGRDIQRVSANGLSRRQGILHQLLVYFTAPAGMLPPGKTVVERDKREKRILENQRAVLRPGFPVRLHPPA